MALRDTSLDSKIKEAAFNEFMEKGYANASLRNIAQDTGATIGAIRTRYRTKNDLFRACIEPLLMDIDKAFVNLHSEYFDEKDIIQNGLIKHLEKSMDDESNLIMDLLFSHYEEAYLLICRSTLSEFENFFEDIIKAKVSSSLEFFRNNTGIEIDENLLSILISLQFHSYSKIIESGCDKETAKKYLKELMRYHKGGFNALFSHKD